MNIDRPLSPEARNLLTTRQSFIVPKAGGELETERAKGTILPPDQFTGTKPDQAPVGRPPAMPHLTYWGGKVLEAPKISNLFLGDYWNTPAGQGDAAHQNGFAQTFGKSGMFDMLTPEYGVGRPEFVGSGVVAGALAKPQMGKDDIIAAVKSAIASGAVKDAAETIHVVYLPPGEILADGSATSLQGLGGYHGSYIDDKGKPVYYAAIVNPDGQNGINFNGVARDNTTITASHELAETVTDPNVSQAKTFGDLGWYDPIGGEIGDLAVNDGAMPLNEAFGRNKDGYAVQVEWDNKNGVFGIQPSQPAKVITASGKAQPLATLGATELQSKISLGKDIDISKLLMDVNFQNPNGVVPQLTLTSPSGQAIPVPVPGVANYKGTLDLSAAAAGLASKGEWFLSATDPTNGGVKLIDWSLHASGIPQGSAK